MKNKLSIFLIVVIFITGCELYIAPSDFLAKALKIQSDSGYYRDKARKLMSKLTQNVSEYEINKVAVIDLVDEDGRVPILGEYFSSRIVEDITHRKIFRVAQKGEIEEALSQLEVSPSLFYSREVTQKVGEILNAEAIINGKITDLGTNLDIQLVLVDIVTGEVIASASEDLNRTKFAVEMLRHF
jgi:hypothetical protein